jgi:hypothetical protein
MSIKNIANRAYSITILLLLLFFFKKGARL